MEACESIILISITILHYSTTQKLFFCTYNVQRIVYVRLMASSSQNKRSTQSPFCAFELFDKIGQFWRLWSWSCLLSTLLRLDLCKFFANCLHLLLGFTTLWVDNDCSGEKRVSKGCTASNRDAMDFEWKKDRQDVNAVNSPSYT